MLTEIYQIGQQQKVVLLIGIGHDRVKELLKPAAIVIYGKKSKAIPAALKEAVNDINEALKQNDNNMHIQAIRKLESVARDYPDPKQDMQLLLFIVAYYEYLNQHKDAIKTFNQALAKYPDSSFASLALCATAVIYEKDLHNPASARAIYNKVAAKYPSSPEAEYANSQLIKIQ